MRYFEGLRYLLHLAYFAYPSTSLFRDLVQNPSIYLPEKEPGYLVRHGKAEASAAYRALFQAAGSRRIVGDASTGYSMRSLYPGVPQRALEILGPGLRILYLVRNPIHRTLSHHYHAMSYGQAPADLAAALKSQPLLVEASRYAAQLEPWLEVYPEAQVRTIVAEEYYGGREQIVRMIFEFLDVPRVEIDAASIHGAGEARRFGSWSVVRKSDWYRRRIAPHLPAEVRRTASRLLLSRGPARPVPPPACLRRLRDALAPDVEKFALITGRSAAPWNLDQTILSLTKGSIDPL